MRVAAETIDDRLMPQLELQLVAVVELGVQRQRLLMDQRRFRMHERQIEEAALLTAQPFALAAADRLLRGISAMPSQANDCGVPRNRLRLN